MLYEMIQKNTNEENNKIKSNSELLKLLSRFYKALQSEAEALEHENK